MTTHTTEMALIAADGYVLEPEYLRACLGAYHDACEAQRHSDVARLCGTFAGWKVQYGIHSDADGNGVRNSVDQIASALFERMTTAPKLTAICELREYGPREVSELLTLRQARALGISAVAYTESARRKFRHEDQREAARRIAATLEA